MAISLHVPTQRRVAVVGAGMAGMACAGALHAGGAALTVFDKGRGVGGRLATRRVDGLRFNHGAQYASAHGPAFQAVLAGMAVAGDAAPWPAPGAGRWAGTPGMSAMARHMAGLGIGAVQAMRHVAHLARTSEGWMVRHLDAATTRPGLVMQGGGEVAGPFDAVVLALPAPQAGALLHSLAHPFAAAADRAGMAPCWTLMLAFPKATEMADLPPPAGALAWIARDSSRPGRSRAPECWVANAEAGWSREHLEMEADEVTQLLVREFAAATGLHQAPAYAAAHRWRYALANTSLGRPALWDAGAGLWVCGDWCLGRRVEDAHTSGRALAHSIITTLTPSPGGRGRRKSPRHAEGPGIAPGAFTLFDSLGCRTQAFSQPQPCGMRRASRSRHKTAKSNNETLDHLLPSS